MSFDPQDPPRRGRRPGPLNLGDPEDNHLRNMEKDLIIPSIKARYIREEKCADPILTYQECVLKAGLIMAPFKCKQLKIDMADCITYWHDSDELLSRAKKEYLADRSEYRRTGVCKDNRDYITKIMKDKQEKGEEIYS